MNGFCVKQTIMHRNRLSEQEGVYLSTLLPLLAANLVQVLITYRYSIDRGWWPVLLAVMTVASIAYASMAVALAHLCRSYRAAVIFRHATVLGLALIADTALFFLPAPDWLASLTALQRLAYDGCLPWLLYLVSYGALFVRFTLRSPWTGPW